MTSPFWGSKVFSASHSNLECFLDRITPTVRAHFLPKSCLRDLNSPWHPVGKNTIEYFTLADLWDQFDEWSAYGLGVPIVLKGGETVVQFYVPYLSGIQIYTSKSFNSLRNPREECEVVEFESDSWSEDSESDKLSRSLSNNSSRTWDAVSEDSNFDQEGSWPMKDRLGSLYFQYFERLPPFLRVPVVYKINELAQNYPGLMTFRSVDLSPASWMAVAWYPIYHIPSGRNVRDLSTCFLTYHTLSSSFQDIASEEAKEKSFCSSEEGDKGEEPEGECSGSISLPPFGLATYKMHGNLWRNPASTDQEKITSLTSAADSWLKQLRLEHHDFTYFTTHS